MLTRRGFRALEIQWTAKCYELANKEAATWDENGSVTIRPALAPAPHRPHPRRSVLSQLQARGAFVAISAHDDTGAPYCVVDLARCVTPQAQRKPDLENDVEDRVNADDVEQRQRDGAGLNHQDQSEDDRAHAASDQQQLVLDLLT